MIRGWRHKGLRDLFETGRTRGVRPEHANRLRLILARLDASTEPRDMNLPGLRLHALKGRMKRTWAVDVSGNWRVTFRFDGKDAIAVDYTDYH
ncbi:MAG TPA: type II toxin-antitoxin system RelE/ParE family toxin [Candidatus Binatia bacterium]|nr:type II toxin-antitoxin system RelE/ParE family toxin [Candidatus Binatia bacterium]